MACNSDFIQYIADQCSGARDYLVDLIKATIPALPKPKAKKNPMR